MFNRANLPSLAACLLALTALGVAGLAWFQTWVNQPLENMVIDGPFQVADSAQVPLADGDVRLELVSLDEGGNTEAIWRCGKVLMGSRHDYSGAWSHLGGWVQLSPASRTLRAGELHLSLGSMRGHGKHPAPNALINTVRQNQWFLEDEHPVAVFRGRTIVSRAPGEESSFDAAVTGWTHTIKGTFQLNGIERDLDIPARVEVGEDRVAIDAAFPISRANFEVAGRVGHELPTEVDDQVVIEVHIHATPDPLSLMGEMHRRMVAQQAKIGRLEDQATQLAALVGRLEASLEELQRESGREATAQGNVDPSKLPARFADRIDYRNTRSDERYKDLGYSADFEMVLMPGDPDQEISPFYVQTTEVTWEMFRAWSYCEDIADETHAVALRESELRPSPCYDDASRGYGFEQRAALGVSRRNALGFCRYVSELTGRPYRLMTDDEWVYLAHAAGGVPDEPQDIAWLADNADTDDWGDPLSMPVGLKPANSLGLHDFWGNVAEWVIDDTQYVRGGSYLVKAEDLTIDWRVDESQDIWNETYPNTPKSKWWYRDRFDMGFRLVCDPVNIPEGQ